ncbi:B12-binding domain-containing radical SAM protein [Deminuibacter soli]|uniref:Radical SAM protein n=1 Tax=Deminuibacter soli TaxID=2291815 RepID=A0A3E1NK11_9BACT|nr:radical SAM protein [Deminuibacter soli]RFM28269.1 radical SAM protein [Deminuibacter soli]
MTQILFSHSYFLRFDPKQWKARQPYAPLGTLYAAALMRETGYSVALYDTMFETDPNNVTHQLNQHQPRYFVLYDDGFNYLTKMCLTNMREAAFTMSRLAKAAGCTVIVSSSDSTDRYAEYLTEGADFILLGEAEMSLQELVAALEKGETDFSHIQGIAYQKEAAIVTTPRRSVLKFLDGLPFPAWDILDITPYKKMWLSGSGYFSINMATTRGCPFKCNWCAKPIYGNRYNSRSPENVVQEIKLLKERLHFDHIWFCDDIFGLKPNWVNEFANLVEQENLHFKFKIQSRADLLLQENYVKALARAGCDNIWMGAESGSQHILDAMDKGTTVEQIYEATRLIKSYGMRPSFFIQFGYIGETKEDIAQTIEMIKILLPDSIGISVSYPLPGTGFYEKVKQDLKFKTNWTDSNEMALMFKNTYQPAYYKQLYSYVHKVYNRHKSLHSIAQLRQHPGRLSGAHIKQAAKAVYYGILSVLAQKKLQQLEHPAAT